MKKSIILLLIISLLISLQFVLGLYSPVIEVQYGSNFSLSGIYAQDSAVLRVTTSFETTCLYGNSPTELNYLGNNGLIHEVYIANLGEGFHKYYIKCGVENPMEVMFTTSIPISAIVQMSKEPPLNEGIYKVSIVTSKSSLGTPILRYTFDEGRTSNLISLTGSGTNWEGDLIIPGSVGETICTFNFFEAYDLSGTKGTKITGDNSFVIDTIVPPTIGMINAVGYEGQVKLDWFSEEDVTEFNIYRSENPQVDYTEFYKTPPVKKVNSNLNYNYYFYDNEVEKGKTYYYRIAGVDQADNIGDLSKEVYATALLNNYSGSSGLNPGLIGRVDNSISEINSVLSNIEEIKSLIELKEEKEKLIFNDIKLDKELDSAISELNSLKRDVESYKLQDLTELELNNKLSSSNLRLNIIKKKVPEDLTILQEKEVQRVLNEEEIQKAFLEYSSDIENDYNKEVAETLNFIEEKNVKITSKFYSLEILYLDGTKKEITLVEDIINSEKDENLYFVLVVPKEIAEKSSELKFMNLEYEIIKDDPVISFSSDTEKIIYYLNKEIEISSLEKILIAPIKIPSDTKDTKITGNSILGSTSKGSLGIVALVIFALILIVYLLRMKEESSIRPVLRIMEDIKKAKELLRNGKEEESKKVYALVKEEYKTLSEKEKRLIIEGIKKMDEKT